MCANLKCCDVYTCVCVVSHHQVNFPSVKSLGKYDLWIPNLEQHHYNCTDANHKGFRMGKEGSSLPSSLPFLTCVLYSKRVTLHLLSIVFTADFFGMVPLLFCYHCLFLLVYYLQLANGYDVSEGVPGYSIPIYGLHEGTICFVQHIRTLS